MPDRACRWPAIPAWLLMANWGCLRPPPFLIVVLEHPGRPRSWIRKPRCSEARRHEHRGNERDRLLERDVDLPELTRHSSAAPPSALADLGVIVFATVNLPSFFSWKVSALELLKSPSSLICLSENAGAVAAEKETSSAACDAIAPLIREVDHP